MVRLDFGLPPGLSANLVVTWVKQRQVQFVFYTTGGRGSWQVCPVTLFSSWAADDDQCTGFDQDIRRRTVSYCKVHWGSLFG